MSGAEHEQLRQPQLAELVASALRDRITSGLLRNGDMLPKQEELLDEFRVSKPSLRGALRILETEGLITVRRGNVGGAVVHTPGSTDAGYMMGLVLQSKGVALSDVGVAVKQVEPMCAALCAEREDRHEVVVPRLREIHARIQEEVGDQIAFTTASRAFHEAIVAECGNETMQLVVGALESIWSAGERDWARRALNAGDFPANETRMEGVRAHERIIELIDKGNAAGVIRTARKHLDRTQIYASGAVEDLVQAFALRGRWV